MTSSMLRFRVRSSSSDEIYNIEAQFEPNLRFSCTCPAGLIGAICKHRTALLLGEVSSVVDVVAEDVKSLSQRAAESPLGHAMKELHSLETQAEKLKREINNRKKQIARIMSGG